MTGESVGPEQAPGNGLTAPEGASDPRVGSPGGSDPGSAPQAGTEGFKGQSCGRNQAHPSHRYMLGRRMYQCFGCFGVTASGPAPLELPRDAAEALYAALGTLLGIPQGDRDAEVPAIAFEVARELGRQVPELPELRAELAGAIAERDQLHRDCDHRDEVIRNLDAGLTHERQQVARLRAERDQARSEGVALQTALVELAGHAGEAPATAACFRGIADRWKYNGVSNLARTADTIRAALDESPSADKAPADGFDIVVLCGSTRFMAEMADVDRELTWAGCIVLRPGLNTKESHPLWADPADLVAAVPRLHELHRAKIRLANRVLVVGNYIGEATRGEIAYARSLGKPVAFTHPEVDPGADPHA